METISTWWNSLQATDQIFWGIALLSSVFFLLQTAATMIGIGDADGIDTDTPTDATIGGTDGAMDLFTVRNMVNFLLGFGWSGVCLRPAIGSTALLVVVSLAIGLAFVALFALVLRQLLKLEKPNQVDFSEAVGTTQPVYLRIPGQMSGRGKVQVSINGSVYEVDALTKGDPIPSGARVKVSEMQGPATYIVEPA